MKKIYIQVRLEDLELHKKVKVRAAQECKTVIELMEIALKNYLKLPIAK